MLFLTFQLPLTSLNMWTGVGSWGWVATVSHWFLSFCQVWLQTVLIGRARTSPQSLLCVMPKALNLSSLLFNLYTRPLGEVWGEKVLNLQQSPPPKKGSYDLVPTVVSPCGHVTTFLVFTNQTTFPASHRHMSVLCRKLAFTSSFHKKLPHSKQCVHLMTVVTT